MDKPILCKSSLRKAVGLMFQSKKTLIFDLNYEQVVFLHMFFVFYPIDIIFLNSDKKIIGIKRKVKPFTPLIVSPKCRYIIETPEIGKYKLGEGIYF